MTMAHEHGDAALPKRSHKLRSRLERLGNDRLLSRQVWTSSSPKYPKEPPNRPLRNDQGLSSSSSIAE
ncbi:hypothetical protein QC761_0074480 [Podospora bellae-mahoneyi]|uniref:Uncharacterized protein n=1 Tax=Podospora bellae-mahoneyi TaxID=2093777 RepID=A0ABR0FBY2_9PEZI|nr:hypothetical protein QC761_0074480 [Podospora bellae-mahoneyi]